MQSGGWKRLRKAVELGPELGAAVRAGSSTWQASVGRSSHRTENDGGRKGAGKREGVQDVAAYGRALPDHHPVLRFEMWGSWSVPRAKALEAQADAECWLRAARPSVCFGGRISVVSLRDRLTVNSVTALGITLGTG